MKDGNWTTNPLVPGGAPSRAGQRLLGLKEASELLGLSPFTVRRLIARGQLPAVRLTRRIQIDVLDLDRLIEQAKDRAG